MLETRLSIKYLISSSDVRVKCIAVFVMFPMTVQLYPLVHQLHCGISAEAGGRMVWASALHTEGRGFDSRAGTLPDFFLSGYLLCGSRFMLSKDTPWVGKLFLRSY